MTRESTFAELFTGFRNRKAGLTQERIAHLMGYDPALLTRMLAGKKDLTGPSGRYRLLLVIQVLADEGVLFSLDEANALLLSAQWHPLHPAMAGDCDVLSRLQRVCA